MTIGLDIELSAMATIGEALDKLDDASRERVRAWIDARFAGHHPSAEAGAIAASAAGRSTKAGRPHSPSTRRILASLRDQSPATPQAVAIRTGLDRKNVKSCLHRLTKTGIVVTEARGLYRPAN